MYPDSLPSMMHLAISIFDLFPGIVDPKELEALLREEDQRMAVAGVTTWAAYRKLSRVGSTIPLGGRQKKAIFNALINNGYL